MPTNIKVQWQYKDVFGIVLRSYSLLNVFNGIKTATGNALNNLIEAGLTVESFVNAGFKVSSVSVANAKWVNSNGNVALYFDLTTVSDPIDYAGVLGVITGFALIVSATIIAGVIATAIATAGLIPEIDIAAVISVIRGVIVVVGLILIVAGAWTVVTGGQGIAGLLVGNTKDIWNDVIAIAAIGLVGVGVVLYFTRKK
jgi:hypothetical protein